jgi:hypothetical protein
MSKKIYFIGALLLILILAACSDSTDSTVAGGEASSDAGGPTNSASEQSGTLSVRLSDGYTDALSVQGQLALGTMQLEDTDLALDESQATELLPLWRAVQSLANSDTAATAEVEAVINQIQDTMAPEQIAAIAAMELTEESLTTMIENQDLAFGLGGRGFPGGGFSTDGSGDDPGGGPGGGDFFFGGGPGGGPGGPGGGPGGGFGNLSEDDIATRQARFAGGGFGDVQDRLLVGVVIRTLEIKTGEVDEAELQERAAARLNPLAIVSETTEIEVEALEEEMAGGATLAEAITTLGGDLEAVKSALAEAYGQLPDAEEQDIGQFIDELLDRSLAFPHSNEGD